MVNGDYEWKGAIIGKYTIRDDGFVCVEFTNGKNRCDIYARGERGNLYFISKKAYRSRVKLEE